MVFVEDIVDLVADVITWKAVVGIGRRIRGGGCQVTIARMLGSETVVLSVAFLKDFCRSWHRL